MSETKTKNLCTVPAADLTDSQYFIAEDGGELKRIPKAQVVLKKLENMLATDTENLAGGGEVTAQELLDALAEQVAFRQWQCRWSQEADSRARLSLRRKRSSSPDA